MNIKSVLTAFLLLGFCTAGWGQKIKYKELIVLLTAKQYDQAEPFLKKYLRDNDDNPNAYLFMGLIYQYNAAKLDPLKNTDRLITVLDSSFYFLNKANAGMTEREISRNEENYQMYSKRDLRTGKFGPNLSDVKLDIEARLKFKDRIQLLKDMRSQLEASVKHYEGAKQKFLKIQSAFPGIKELYLRSNEQLILDLEHLAAKYDSCHISFNDYKATSKAYGRTGYNQDLNPQEIKDFKKDGQTDPDFFKDNVTIWDYKRWALSTMDIVEKEVKPAMEQLISHDKELNNLQSKLKQDSVSVKPALKELSDKSYAFLKKIDPSALPLQVFELKEAELLYGSQIVEDRPIRDSINLIRQAAAIHKEMRLANQIDSLGTILTGKNIAEEAMNYDSFVKAAYGSAEVLSSFIRTSREYGVREKILKEGQMGRKSNSLRWVLAGADSIPLFLDVQPKSRFKPLLVNAEQYTTGLQYGADSIPSGYFYSITPSRKPEVKATYAVDPQAFKRRNLSFTKALSAQDAKGQIYFVVLYSEVKVKEKYPVTIVKIYRTDGLAWSVNHSFTQMPSEVNYSSELSELLIKTKNAAGELIPVSIDKNGKEVK